MKRYMSLLCRSLALATYLLASSTLAFTCKTPSGGIIPPGGSSTPVDVRVNVSPDVSSGLNQILDVAQITCTNDSNIGNWVDYLKTDAPGLSWNVEMFHNAKTIVALNDNFVTYPLPAGLKVIELPSKQSDKVSIQIFVELANYPTQDVKISKGDVLGQINFIQSNNQSGCPMCGPYRWRLIADNDAYFVTNSCTINNGKKIDVDFDPIRQDFLTVNTEGAQIKVDKMLYYQCKDTRATQDVLIRLVSDTPGFSADFIKTSNPNVGIAMMHNGKVIKPNGAFRGRIVNGSGSDPITFVPVKNNVPYSDITTGMLSGSATLIFSAP